MGLFSKKTLTCGRCGNQYEARLNTGLCPQCEAKEEAQRERIQGYVDYRRDCDLPPIPYEEMPDVEYHRQELGDKFFYEDGITYAELEEIGKNYRSLTEEQAIDVIHRIAPAMITLNTGASSGEEFFVLSEYERVIVDMDDVFAVGLTHARGYENDKVEVILAVVFTNDPYVPAFPQVYLGDLGFWSIGKSKAGRAAVADFFTSRCENLQYPVCDLKQLRGMIRKEDHIDANMDKEMMLDLIEKALAQRGVFKVRKLDNKSVPAGTIAMLDSMGYLTSAGVVDALRTDKMLQGRFWHKIIDIA